jgi:hypothetical protein
MLLCSQSTYPNGMHGLTTIPHYSFSLDIVAPSKLKNSAKSKKILATTTLGTVFGTPGIFFNLVL